MAAIIQSVQAAVTSVPHEAAKVRHAQKILLVVTGATVQMPDHRSGYFWAELLHPYEQFTKAGWDVDIASENGQATVDEASVTSMANGGDKKKYEDKQFPLHAKLAAIKSADALNVNDYAAVFFAGGHACCVDMPTASKLQTLAAKLYETGGTVGAVCHGIAIFDNLKLSNGNPIVKGKRVTGFSTTAEKAMKVDDWMKQHGFKTMQEVVETNGGEWHEHATNPMAEYTECSDRVVTGMNPASAGAVADSMMKILPQAPKE